MKVKITARFVVGFKDGDHVIYENGVVVYDGDQIVHVGHDYDGPVDTVVDEGLAVVGPGFVDLNALGDIDHAILDSFQSPLLGAGLQWSTDYVRRRQEVFSRADEKAKRRYAFGQLLRNGITTALPIASEIYKSWAETYDEMADAADAAADLGLRVYLGPSYRSSVSVIDENGKPSFHHEPGLGEQGLDDAIRFVESVNARGDALLRGMLAPSRIETLTPELIKRSRAASDDLGCPIRLHAGQMLTEVAVLQDRYGKRPLPLLADLGFLGPRTLIPHAWAVAGHSQLSEATGDDLALLHNSGTTVVFCPIAVARYAVVLESFDRYVDAGISVAMGTDTAPPDMIKALDTGMALTKAVERRRDAAQVGRLYRAATIVGAEAIGRPDLGRLAPGAQADIISIDLSGPHVGVVDDPIRTVVMNCNGRDIRRVIVAGRTVVDDRQLVGGDPEADIATAQHYFDRYRRSYSTRDYLGRSEDELFPPTFRMLRS